MSCQEEGDEGRDRDRPQPERSSDLRPQERSRGESEDLDQLPALALRVKPADHPRCEQLKDDRSGWKGRERDRQAVEDEEREERTSEPRNPLEVAGRREADDGATVGPAQRGGGDPPRRHQRHEQAGGLHDRRKPRLRAECEAARHRQEQDLVLGSEDAARRVSCQCEEARIPPGQV